MALGLDLLNITKDLESKHSLKLNCPLIVIDRFFFGSYRLYTMSATIN